MIYLSATGKIKGPNGSISDDSFPIRRGVLQGDILSPVLFIICLNSIWMRAEDINNDGWEIDGDWKLTELSYADDITTLDISPENSERRLQKLGDVANDCANMSINISKTKRMIFEMKPKVGETTEEEVKEYITKNTKANSAEYKCEYCDRIYLNKKSLSAHVWQCDVRFPERKAKRGRKSRTRTGQKLDKLIKADKLVSEVKKRKTISLNNAPIENVNIFRYLGGLISSYDEDSDEVAARIDKA